MSDLNTTNQKLLVDTQEAARMLSLCKRTVFTLTQNGELPTVRIGRSVRYRVVDLEAWAAARATPHATPDDSRKEVTS